MLDEASLIERINNKVAQQKISNKQLRNEEIRRTGYAPDYASTTQSTSGKQPNTLAGLYQTNLGLARTLDDLYGGSSSDGNTTGSTSSGRGGSSFGGYGPTAGMAAGYAANQLGQAAGLPGFVAGPLGGIASAAIGRGEVVANDIANIGLKGLVSAMNPYAGLALGLAGLFGKNPVDTIASYFGLPGLMSTKGLMTAQDEETTAIAMAQSEALAQEAAVAGKGMGAEGQDVGYGGYNANEGFDSLGPSLGDTTTTTGGWGAGLSDGFGGGFSDGQASDAW